MFLNKSILLLVLTVCISITSFAAKIKGAIIDKESGEQLVGALVSLEGTKYGTATELDGSFTLNNIPAGTYKIKVQYTSYETFTQEVTLTQDQTFTLNVKLGIKASTLKEVQITGKYEKGSDEESQNREKYGHEIMNVMSERTISLSPDITVASVLQRVSGVSIENTNSGKQYAIIRGMDKKYNSTLINGVKIPSPDDRDRYVPVDIFPSELLERLEVIKTLSPSMEGDGTGGVVNMVMKNAPDKLICTGNFGAGYGLIFQDQDFLRYRTNLVNWRSPSEIAGPGSYAVAANFPLSALVVYPINHPINTVYGATVGNRFLNNKLGLVVSGSFQNTFKGYKSDAYLQSSTLEGAVNNHTQMTQPFSDLNYREFSTQSDRLGMMARLDYELNDKNSLSLFATYVSLDEYRTRFTADSEMGGHSVNGYVFYNSIHNRIQTRSTLQDIYNVTLQGKHKFASNLLGDWSLVTSEAKQQLPDEAQFTYIQAINVAPNGDVSIAAPLNGGMDRAWYRNSDKDLSTYLNLHYSPGFLKGLSMIDIGGMYRHKMRDNYANRYSLVSAKDAHGNDLPYTSITNAQYLSPQGQEALGTPNDPGTYTFHEDILAYYIQLNYDITNRINLFGGVRVENTDNGYDSNLPVSIRGKSATYIYTDFLPSVQAKYKINDKSAIRASYFTSVYRPAYGDLVPNPNTSLYEDYDFIGNPDLKHTVVNNADLRYEIFPKGLDQLMVGVFEKVIQNPIEYEIGKKDATTDAVFPNNFGTANNAGFELVFRKYFGSFGIGGNYTFTNSEITTKKNYWYYTYHPSTGQNDSLVLDSVNQKRPLTGQSTHIGNISLLYRNTRNKIEAQLAFVYTGERIYLVSPFWNLDLWQKPTLSLDFSIEKQFGKHITAYLKANNLLNSGFELFIKGANTRNTGDAKLRLQESSNYTTVEKDYYKSSFLFGFKYKM